MCWLQKPSEYIYIRQALDEHPLKGLADESQDFLDRPISLWGRNPKVFQRVRSGLSCQSTTWGVNLQNKERQVDSGKWGWWKLIQFFFHWLYQSR